MDLCLITIGGIKFCAAEIDLLHLLMEDDDPHWTVLEISNALPYDVSDTWEYTQSLILSGIIERADMSQSLETISNITLTVPSSATDWMAEHQQDIDDAFIVLNPDMFDVTEVADA